MNNPKARDESPQCWAEAPDVACMWHTLYREEMQRRSWSSLGVCTDTHASLSKAMLHGCTAGWTKGNNKPYPKLYSLDVQMIIFPGKGRVFKCLSPLQNKKLALPWHNYTSLSQEQGCSYSHSSTSQAHWHTQCQKTYSWWKLWAFCYIVFSKGPPMFKLIFA